MDKQYSESETLKKVLDEVLKFTGIDIKEPGDIKRFEDLIEFKIDKHRENYPEVNPEEKTEVKLMRILYSVFNFMNEPYNENMPLNTFVEMKAIAEERIKQAEIQKLNGKQ